MPTSLAPPVAGFIYVTTALFMKQRFGLDFTTDEIESLLIELGRDVTQEARDGNYAPWLRALSQKFTGQDWPARIQPGGAWVRTFIQELQRWRWGNLQIGDRVLFVTHYKTTCARPHGAKDKEYRVRFKNFDGPTEIHERNTYVELDDFVGKVGLGCIIKAS